MNFSYQGQQKRAAVNMTNEQLHCI